MKSNISDPHRGLHTPRTSFWLFFQCKISSKHGCFKQACWVYNVYDIAWDCVHTYLNVYRVGGHHSFKYWLCSIKLWNLEFGKYFCLIFDKNAKLNGYEIWYNKNLRTLVTFPPCFFLNFAYRLLFFIHIYERHENTKNSHTRTSTINRKHLQVPNIF